MKREGPLENWGLKQWGMLLAGFVIVPPVASWVGRTAGGANTSREMVESSGSASVPEVKTIASSQRADGLSDQLMDQSFLSKLNSYTVERQVVNTKRALQNRGITTPVPQPTSSSVYVMSGGHKVAVVRTRMAKGGVAVHSAFLLAVFGQEVRRVGCFSPEREVSITFGPCADKVEETYGFRIGG